MRTRILLLAVVGVTLAVTAAPARAATFIGLTGNNGLIQFDSAYPGSPSTEIPITGLQQSESIHGIDFRPANGMLYGVGSTNRLYTINAATGAATEVGPLGMTPSGTMFGFDFNPVSDRLIIATDADEILVVDPNSGMAAPGPSLMYTGGMQNPYIIGLAFSNNVPGAASTTQYGLDFSNNDLVMIDPATGVVTSIGDLGPSPGPLTGFDITRDGMAFFASGPFFHMVNLATGNAPSAGMFPNPLFVKGLAAVPPANGTPGGGTPGGTPGGGTPGGQTMNFFDVNGDRRTTFDEWIRDLGTKNLVDDRAFKTYVPANPVTPDQMRMFIEVARRGAAGASAAQRRRVVLARKTTTLGARAKRVSVPLTRAGKRFMRGYTRKRLKVTMSLRLTYIPTAGAPQTRKLSGTVTFRVKRKRR